MDESAREVYKNSLIRGTMRKYGAEKELLLAQVTLLLEGDVASPEEAIALFEKKINRLAEVETILVQLDMMFTGREDPQEKREASSDGVEL